MSHFDPFWGFWTSLSSTCWRLYGDGSKPWYLVNHKTAGKWMFIPLKFILIGFDPSPYHIPNSCVMFDLDIYQPLFFAVEALLFLLLAGLSGSVDMDTLRKRPAKEDLLSDEQCFSVSDDRKGVVQSNRFNRSGINYIGLSSISSFHNQPEFYGIPNVIMEHPLWTGNPILHQAEFLWNDRDCKVRCSDHALDNAWVSSSDMGGECSNEIDEFSSYKPPFTPYIYIYNIYIYI